MDRHGVIFKIIGDRHPGTHYLGYVKYYPDEKGGRTLFGRAYKHNSVVSKSFGILAGGPDCYVYSDVLGCVITGIPREQVTTHYSCRRALRVLHEHPGAVADNPIGKDLLAITDRVMAEGVSDLLGVTGSFLVGCFNERSDIDLVCYGPEGVSGQASSRALRCCQARASVAAPAGCMASVVVNRCTLAAVNSRPFSWLAAGPWSR
jgi:predicted nucleotidyltransferase